MAVVNLSMKALGVLCFILTIQIALCDITPTPNQCQKWQNVSADADLNQISRHNYNIWSRLGSLYGNVGKLLGSVISDIYDLTDSDTLKEALYRGSYISYVYLANPAHIIDFCLFQSLVNSSIKCQQTNEDCPTVVETITTIVNNSYHFCTMNAANSLKSAECDFEHDLPEFLDKCNDTAIDLPSALVTFGDEWPYSLKSLLLELYDSSDKGVRSIPLLFTFASNDMMVDLFKAVSTYDFLEIVETGFSKAEEGCCEPRFARLQEVCRSIYNSLEENLEEMIDDTIEDDLNE